MEKNIEISIDSDIVASKKVYNITLIIVAICIIVVTIIIVLYFIYWWVSAKNGCVYGEINPGRKYSYICNGNGCYVK